MLPGASEKSQQKRRRVKYRGLLVDAAALGVHRNHLYQVLDGRRVSKQLAVQADLLLQQLLADLGLFLQQFV